MESDSGSIGSCIKEPMKKLCYVATIPAVVHAFLRGHIQAAAEKYEVTVVCNATDAYLLKGINARFVFLPVERKPSPWKDGLFLVRLVKLFRAEKFDIVHSHMPKTGLLGMLAARLVGIPIRINTFHGEVWATRKGWMRAAFKLSDRFVVWLATDILVVSPSQQEYLINEGIFPPGKSKIIGAGSICGVDSLRFVPSSEARQTTRDSLGIPTNARVILFMGRLNRDKGMLDLAAAFKIIAAAHPDVVLLLVGAEEDVPFAKIEKICHVASNRLHYVNFTASPQRYMAGVDIFCLPSYREGLPMTILEAAACGVPAVASRIYGITDAVDADKTGILFKARDVKALTQALETLLMDDVLRKKMGDAARLRVLDLFASEKIIQDMMVFYDNLCKRL